MQKQQSQHASKHRYLGGLPMLPLGKDKKYYRPHHNQENVLKHDIDHLITTLVPRPSCLRARPPLIKSLPPPSSDCSFPPQLKALKLEIGLYTDKLASPTFSGLPCDDYSQFLRLSRESQDYLEYYIKNHFKHSPEAPLCQGKQSVLLSLLKNNYRCLTDNPEPVAQRILLALGVNPLNDFHLVPWEAFSRLRRLVGLKQSRSEGRKFLVGYFMVGRNRLGRGQFWGMVGGVLRKLGRVINESNGERLVERVAALGEFVPKEMTKEQLQNLMASQWFFIWDELLRLIFTI